MEGQYSEKAGNDELVYQVVDLEEEYGVEIEEEEDDDYTSQLTDESEMTNEEKLL